MVSGAYQTLFETQARKDLSPKVIRGGLQVDHLTVAILGPVEAGSACLFSDRRTTAPLGAPGPRR